MLPTASFHAALWPPTHASLLTVHASLLTLDPCAMHRRHPKTVPGIPELGNDPVKHCQLAKGNWCGPYWTQKPLPAKAPPRGDKECPGNCNGVGWCDYDTGVHVCLHSNYNIGVPQHFAWDVPHLAHVNVHRTSNRRPIPVRHVTCMLRRCLSARGCVVCTAHTCHCRLRASFACYLISASHTPHTPLLSDASQWLLMFESAALSALA